MLGFNDKKSNERERRKNIKRSGRGSMSVKERVKESMWVKGRKRQKKWRSMTLREEVCE